MTHLDKDTLAIMVSANDDQLRLASAAYNLQRYNCFYLRIKILRVIEKLCEIDNIDFCDNNVKELISYLCNLWKYYKKYCCRCIPICLPRPQPWYDLLDTLLVHKRVYNTANISTVGKFDVSVVIGKDQLGGSGDDGFDFDFEDILPLPCDTIKIDLSRTIKIVCEIYKEKSLCGKNELTESLNHICELYPRFVEYCC